MNNEELEKRLELLQAQADKAKADGDIRSYEQLCHRIAFIGDALMCAD